MKLLILFCCALFSAQYLLAQDSASVRIDTLICAYQRLSRFSGSALVYRQGRPILEKGYGLRNIQGDVANDPQTIFQIASITKTFTATLVLKLAEDGHLSLTDRLSKYYPTFPRGGEITLENLLSHTSGLYDYTREDTPVQLNTETRMLAFLAKKELDFPPGTDWRYSNSGYSVLGFIIARVSGMTYEQAVRRYIFQPLHMNHSGFDFEDLAAKDKATGYSISDGARMVASFSDSSVVFAAGAIYSTVEDLYAWHRGLQSYAIVGKTLMDRAYIPYKKNYGFGWIVDSIEGRPMVYHSGNIAGFCSILVRIPSDDICIVLLNNQEGTELEGIARQILDILYGRPYTLPTKKTAITLSNDVLLRYVGIYDVADLHMTLEVILQNGQLMAHIVNGPTFPLTAESETKFFIEEGKAEATFVVGVDGKAQRVILYQNDQKKTGIRIK